MNDLFRNLFFSLVLGSACSIPIYADDLSDKQEQFQDSELSSDRSVLLDGIGSDVDELVQFSHIEVDESSQSREPIQENKAAAKPIAPQEGLGTDAEELLLLCKDSDLTVPEEPKPSMIEIQAKRFGIYLFYLAHDHPFISGCITGVLAMLGLISVKKWFSGSSSTGD